jgi:hypothetical protein
MFAIAALTVEMRDILVIAPRQGQEKALARSPEGGVMVRCGIPALYFGK